MSIRLLSLPLLMVISACGSAPSGPSEPYAFVGSWDCGVRTFTFTNSTYNDGANTYPIQNVARNGRNYTLRFGNGYLLALGAVTATGLTWVSGQTGDQLNCVRVK
jgi:hypothetical protein